MGGRERVEKCKIHQTIERHIEYKSKENLFYNITQSVNDTSGLVGTFRLEIVIRRHFQRLVGCLRTN